MGPDRKRLGSLVIGFRRPAEARSFFEAQLRLFVFVGLLGGFTTFSSFALRRLSVRERRSAAGSSISACNCFWPALRLARLFMGRAMAVDRAAAPMNMSQSAALPSGQESGELFADLNGSAHAAVYLPRPIPASSLTPCGNCAASVGATASILPSKMLPTSITCAHCTTPPSGSMSTTIFTIRAASTERLCYT
jgi:hypothetical protein